MRREGETQRFYDFAPERRWRHLDTLQYKTYIACRLPRVKNASGKVVTIDPPWASSHQRNTYLFECAVIDLLQTSRNQTKTAKLMRCGFNVVNKIIHTSTLRGLERRKEADVHYTHLSLDEKSFKKGHHYVSVLSDPDTGNVVEVEENRDKQASKDLINRALPTEKQKNSVKTISMDMWKAYMTVSKELLPQADIFHDRFHLVKYLNGAIDKVRRREVKKHEELKNTRYALLKKEANLTEKQRIKFESIRGANYEVSHAWQIKENFRDLFGSKTEEGLALFNCWARDGLNKKIKEVSKVIEMFQSTFSWCSGFFSDAF